MLVLANYEKKSENWLELALEKNQKSACTPKVHHNQQTKSSKKPNKEIALGKR